jgi:hypothetical protein
MIEGRESALNDVTPPERQKEVRREKNQTMGNKYSQGEERT